MKLLRIALLFVLTTSCFVTQAQRKTYLGVNGGMNFGATDIFHSFNGFRYNMGFRTGYQGGIVVMNYMENHFGIEAGLSYVQKGWVQSFNTGEPDFGTYLDYLELPFMASIYSGDKNLHFYINAGCFFEYLVKSKVDPEPVDPGESEYVLFDENRDNKYGYGFKVTGGAFYDFKFGTIKLDINGSYSLSPIFDPPNLASQIPNISNKLNLGFTVGYLFSFTTSNNRN